MHTQTDADRLLILLNPQAYLNLSKFRNHCPYLTNKIREVKTNTVL